MKKHKDLQELAEETHEDMMKDADNISKNYKVKKK